MSYYAVDKKNDELKHWKYIKKIKGKNGKWRYIYDKSELKDDVADALGFDERKEYIDQKNKTDKAYLRKTVADINMQSAYDYRMNNSRANRQKKGYEMMSDYVRRSKQYDKEVNRLKRVKKTYYKTPIGRVEKYADKGRRAVEALLS